MLKFFFDWIDYVYYRLCLVYRYFNDPEAFSAMLLVSLVKTLLMLDVVLILISNFVNKEDIYPHSKNIGLIAGAYSILRMYLDSKIYSNKFDELNSKWKDESLRTRLVKGLLVFLTIVCSWLPLFILGQR